MVSFNIVNIISLTALDLGLAAVLVILLAVLSMRMRLGLERSILISAARTVVQLLLVGLVLKAIFANAHLGWIIIIALVMLIVAGREVMVRQNRRFKGIWGFGLGTSSMFVSTFVVTLLSLTVVINAQPWYTPQYAIPLLGMMFGNTMNGIALGLDRLTQTTWQNRAIIEGRLLLGYNWRLAISDIHRESIRAGSLHHLSSLLVLGRCRYRFRVFSGTPGRPPRSDRGAEARMTCGL